MSSNWLEIKIKECENYDAGKLCIQKFEVVEVLQTDHDQAVWVSFKQDGRVFEVLVDETYESVLNKLRFM